MKLLTTIAQESARTAATIATCVVTYYTTVGVVEWIGKTVTGKVKKKEEAAPAAQTA